jgi:hypothetical protein
MVTETDRPNDIVITVEPIRETWRTSDERRAEVRNDASSLGDWRYQESAWLLGQFLKVAVSVAASRGIHQLFRSRLASEFAYRRAPYTGVTVTRSRKAVRRIDPGLSGREAPRDRSPIPYARIPPPRMNPRGGNASEKPKYITSIE